MAAIIVQAINLAAVNANNNNNDGGGDDSNGPSGTNSNGDTR